MKYKRVSLYSSYRGKYNELRFGTEPENLACHTF